MHKNIIDMRSAAMEIASKSLAACDPLRALKMQCAFKDGIFNAGAFTVEVADYDRVWILGAGKATMALAVGLEELLGEHLAGGIISVKNGTKVGTKKLLVYQAAHPIPNGVSNEAAKAIIALASKLNERDLVFSIMTGGSSALLSLPVANLSMDEKAAVHKVLLESGAPIGSINTVRKHLSNIKGGRLAKAIAPASIVNLTVSDVVGDRIDLITGPTVPDPSTLGEARDVLTTYELWTEMPPKVVALLRAEQALEETPKVLSQTILTKVLVSGSTVCEEAAKQAKLLGFMPKILSTNLEGSAEDAVKMFLDAIQIARATIGSHALIAGGETTIALPKNVSGTGGPNQHFAAAMAKAIKDDPLTVVLAIDTDGTDGPTTNAGGLVDGETYSRCENAGVDLDEELALFNSSRVLSASGDLVITGHTGTNVNDLKMVLLN